MLAAAAIAIAIIVTAALILALTKGRWTWLFLAGLVVVVGAWLPVLAGALFDPAEKYIEGGYRLGIVAWLGTAAGVLLLILDLLWRLFSRWRS